MPQGRRIVPEQKNCIGLLTKHDACCQEKPKYFFFMLSFSSLLTKRDNPVYIGSSAERRQENVAS
ncbi:MAG: hypothetical protein D3906_08865 [Candidatus Electrothrix sp. AUS1_2]|nr:hypothetical protein [Candidatus Electrothrix sp. AUS1_2]